MTGAVLTLNAGSSSLKFALFDGASLAVRVRGEVETLADAPHLLARDAGGAVLAEQRWPAQAHPFATVLEALLSFADAHLGSDGLGAVGHRVVHGGASHRAPERVTPALLTALEALTPLDPLHMPHNLAPHHPSAGNSLTPTSPIREDTQRNPTTGMDTICSPTPHIVTA